MSRTGKKVVVGMSGGVDSSVAAALLKEEGYEVTGVFMKNWADPKYPCPWQEDRRDAMRVAAMLDIPFETWDFSQEYRAAVVSYMIREYAAGRTPNPDVMCNREIKFGVFSARARAEGADFIATGHYARVTCDREHDLHAEAHVDCRVSLHAAHDANKDQTYFLWTLTQPELSHTLFPLGKLTKPEVRAIARAHGLPTAEKPDSQGVCFVGEIDVAGFLRDHIPSRRGDVLTRAGKKVGEHEGVQFYTIGQRHGIGIGGGMPYYVASKNFSDNTLIVAEGPNDPALFARRLHAVEANWIVSKQRFPLRCEARIRYRQPLQKCRVEKTGAGELIVTFEDDQRAITPGQSIVFYSAGEVLGGAIIR